MAKKLDIQQDFNYYRNSQKYGNFSGTLEKINNS